MNLFNKKKKNEKGFTLVELLVVIAIIGILAAVIAPNIFAQIEKGKTSSVISEYRAAKTAALLMITDNPAHVLTNTITDAPVISFHANLEKNIINAVTPFGGTAGTYTVNTDPAGQLGKFLIIPNVPRDAGRSIHNTIVGGTTVTVIAAQANLTSSHEVVWIGAGEPEAGQSGTLALRLLP